MTHLQEMVLKERDHPLRHLRRAKRFTSMSGARQPDELDLCADVVERPSEELALMARHETIAIAVNDEERRRTAIDITDGVRVSHPLRLLLNGSTH